MYSNLEFEKQRDDEIYYECAADFYPIGQQYDNNNMKRGQLSDEECES